MAGISQKHMSSKKTFCRGKNTTGMLHNVSQLHFISVDSHRTFVREGPDYKDRTGGDSTKKYMEKI